MFLDMSCPTGWHYYDTNCYYVSDNGDRVDHTTARKKCMIMGADLVSISNQAEMDFVMSISYVRISLFPLLVSNA